MGEGVPREESWPVLLTARLRDVGHEVADPRILARTGWTTEDLCRALLTERPRLDPPYPLATLMIGVNDQYDHRPALAFQTGFEDLLEACIALTGNVPGRVVTLSIPDYSVTPHARDLDPPGIREELRAYNEFARRRAASAGAHFVDVTELSREAAHDPTLLTDDGLHPSGEMYARWVERIFPVAEGALTAEGEGSVGGSDPGDRG